MPKSKDSFTPVIWGQTDFDKCCSNARKIYDEARNYEIKSGISLSFYNAYDDITNICLASSLSEKEFKNFIKKEKSRLLSTLELGFGHQPVP